MSLWWGKVLGNQGEFTDEIMEELIRDVYGKVTDTSVLAEV
jgi:hypothetical protein